MKQAARELTAFDEGFLNGKRYVLMDRDKIFCSSFRQFLSDQGTQPKRMPPRSPDLTAFWERLCRSLKSECLERMIFFGEQSLRRAIRQYLEHYHAERNHQGLENQLIEPSEHVGAIAGQLECRKRMGGLLRYYHRVAA